MKIRFSLLSATLATVLKESIFHWRNLSPANQSELIISSANPFTSYNYHIHRTDHTNTRFDVLRQNFFPFHKKMNGLYKPNTAILSTYVAVNNLIITQVPFQMVWRYFSYFIKTLWQFFGKSFFKQLLLCHNSKHSLMFGLIRIAGPRHIKFLVAITSHCFVY